MTDRFNFQELDQLRLNSHGDSREIEMWLYVSDRLSNYERFWRTFVVLLTNRVDPKFQLGTAEWIRMRSGLPREFEDFAMRNYSVYYYAAATTEHIKLNRELLAQGRHCRPELTFALLQICLDNCKAWQSLARDILRRFSVNPRLPKYPEDWYRIVGIYRNAFLHDPILGRAVSHGRECVPPPEKLPRGRKKTDFIRWSEIEHIPTAEMVDCLELLDKIWDGVTSFLQNSWDVLTNAFTQIRTLDTFIEAVGLTRLLPIRLNLGGLSTAVPFAASGAVILPKA